MCRISLYFLYQNWTYCVMTHSHVMLNSCFLLSSKCSWSIREHYFSSSCHFNSKFYHILIQSSSVVQTFKGVPVWSLGSQLVSLYTNISVSNFEISIWFEILINGLKEIACKNICWCLITHNSQVICYYLIPYVRVCPVWM